MALPSSFLVALVVLGCSSICFLSCSWSYTHSLVNGGPLMLLEQMKRISLLFCLQARNDFGLPQEVLGGKQLQKPQASSVVHEMILQTYHLFCTKRPSAPWDKALLAQFCTGLDQRLEACSTQEEERYKDSTFLAMRKYFARIRIYLQKKKTLPLCLGDCQNGNPESLVFISKIGGKTKK